MEARIISIVSKLSSDDESVRRRNLRSLAFKLRESWLLTADSVVHLTDALDGFLGVWFPLPVADGTPITPATLQEYSDALFVLGTLVRHTYGYVWIRERNGVGRLRHFKARLSACPSSTAVTALQRAADEALATVLSATAPDPLPPMPTEDDDAAWQSALAAATAASSAAAATATATTTTTTTDVLPPSLPPTNPTNPTSSDGAIPPLPTSLPSLPGWFAHLLEPCQSVALRQSACRLLAVALSRLDWRREMGLTGLTGSATDTATEAGTHVTSIVRSLGALVEESPAHAGDGVILAAIRAVFGSCACARAVGFRCGLFAWLLARLGAECGDWEVFSSTRRAVGRRRLPVQHCTLLLRPLALLMVDPDPLSVASVAADHVPVTLGRLLVIADAHAVDSPALMVALLGAVNNYAAMSTQHAESLLTGGRAGPAAALMPPLARLACRVCAHDVPEPVAGCGPAVFAVLTTVSHVPLCRREILRAGFPARCLELMHTTVLDAKHLTTRMLRVLTGAFTSLAALALDPAAQLHVVKEARLLDVAEAFMSRMVTDVGALDEGLLQGTAAATTSGDDNGEEETKHAAPSSSSSAPAIPASHQRAVGWAAARCACVTAVRNCAHSASAATHFLSNVNLMARLVLVTQRGLLHGARAGSPPVRAALVRHDFGTRCAAFSALGCLVHHRQKTKALLGDPELEATLRTAFFTLVEDLLAAESRAWIADLPPASLFWPELAATDTA